MKKILKHMAAVILCAVIAIAVIGADSVYAVDIPFTHLEVTFNGKSINLTKEPVIVNDKTVDAPTLKELEKKWGKPKTVQDDDSYLTTYVWKKGKTVIQTTQFYSEDVEHDGMSMVNVDIRDKNGAMFGVKVGMKKSTALKKLREKAGKKNVCVVKEGQAADYSEDKGFFATGKATGKSETIYVFTGYNPCMIALKNGKVKSLGFTRI